jgi:hypothetical protein
MDRTSREQQVSLSSTQFVVAAMLIAGDSIAETTTPNSDEGHDSFPPIEEILYRALQKRDLGVVGEHCSTANAGRGEGEEAFSGQRDNAICNSASTLVGSPSSGA